MGDASEDALATYRRKWPEPQFQGPHDTSQTGGPGDTYGGMDRVWDKLAEHDKRFDRIEAQMLEVTRELSNAKFWFVGTAFAITFAGLGLVYAARQDTTALVGTALTAIQTAVAVKQEPAPPAAAAQPTIIVVPTQGAPITMRPPAEPPKP